MTSLMASTAVVRASQALRRRPVVGVQRIGNAAVNNGSAQQSGRPRRFVGVEPASTKSGMVIDDQDDLAFTEWRSSEKAPMDRPGRR